MKIGFLVRCYYRQWYGMVGLIIKEVREPLCETTTNKVFDILFQDGTIGHNIWNYDLEVVDEKR